MVIDFIFYLALAGLISHELDAIHKEEWRMIFVLRNMENTAARNAFILLHIPLLVVILWFTAHPDPNIRYWFTVTLDGFMIIHAFLHLRLAGHPAYKFKSRISKLLIFGTAIAALIHLVLFL